MPTVDQEARRRELAEFLRSRRERLTPEAAGLASRRRSRTPGLRREDVAELAGIGTAWYTWLEQARDIRPSEAALRRIARALRLDATEERYLLELVLECVPEVRSLEEIVAPDLQRLLEAIDGPAYIKGRRWDLLATNAACDAVFGYADIPERNALRIMFRPEQRILLPNWAASARQHVAMFRADCAGLLEDPWIAELVDELTRASEEFRGWWLEHAVQEMKSGHQTYDHPDAGQLSLEFSILQSADSPNLRLVVFLPDDQESRERIAQLTRARRGRSAPSAPTR
jgi:transcriptional regulator with XRE-family HTH domain